MFRVDADIEPGDWQVTQGSTRTSVSVTCDSHTQITLDDWPPSPVHDDIWHDVKVCQGTLSDMSEQDGTVTVPERFNDFEIQVLAGSDRIGRGDHDTELRLRLLVPTGEVITRPLGEPIIATLPLANAPVDACVAAGPSSEAHVMCLVTPTAAGPSPNAANTCLTDPDGMFIVRYRVPLDAVDVFAMQQDALRVYIDRDRDGTHDHTANPISNEPAGTLKIPVAKAVNYIALGDSYSSGENGRSDTERNTFTGEYLTDNPAGEDCRRWDKAYPAVFARQYLGSASLTSDVSFDTFACTGAITHNIYNPGDPNGESLDIAHAVNNRPSDKAPSIHPVLNPDTDAVELVPLPGWEPRQSVSLATAQRMRVMDTITLTVGGNDIGFADVLIACVSPTEFDGTCGSDDLLLEIDDVRDRIIVVLEQIKMEAPDASIFIMGYPFVTSKVDPCNEPYRRPSRPGAPIELVFESEECEAQRNMYRPAIVECDSLSASGVLSESGLFGKLISLFSSGDRRIDYSEAKFLRSSAVALNAVVREAAQRSGVHYVDVVGGVRSSGGPLSFEGHAPCDIEAQWLYGFVVEPKNASLKSSAASRRSFHPNEAGHEAYAHLLEQYIRNATTVDGAELNEAGLPVNPGPVGGSSDEARSPAGRATAPDASKGSDSGARQSGGSSNRAEAGDDEDAVDGGGEDSLAAPEPTAGYLVPQRVVAVSGCGSPFVSPGERIRLVAGGFATGASVSFTAQAVSLGDTEPTAPMLVPVTADADGVVDALWSVPSAPAVSGDAAPRAYLVDASGPGAGGGTHTAYMMEPLVAYPGTVPCAVADTASTVLGQPVQVAVLSNDVAPTGGTLDEASVEIRGASGGVFSVNDTTGVVTFVPDAGFYGVAEGSYAVYDSWGVGVVGDIVVTVTSACTITGTAGETTITGTEGNDVICVPDPEDRRAFHVIDAGGGDDVIVGGAGVEWIYASTGADIVYGRGGDDRIVAGAGTDTIHGGAGMDHIYSTDFADTVVDDDGGYELVVAPPVAVAQSAPDTVDDWAWVDASQTTDLDVLGNDHDPNEDLDPTSLTIARQPVDGTAAVAGTSDGRTVISYTASATGGTDTLAYQVCDALGGCGSAEVTVMIGDTGCTIIGTDAAETLHGTAGDDVICGKGGDDVIYGLDGDDIIVGGAGDDTLYGGNATLIGAHDGDDILWGGAGDDTLYGGAGRDMLWGGSGEDEIAGNRGEDDLHAGDGDDTAVGGGENDRIWGGLGDDTLDGHAADDTIWGGLGDDSLRGGNGDDTIWGAQGTDTLTGGAGADTLHGGSGNDTLEGNTQNDILWGGAGDDNLYGAGHADQLHGGSGNDTLRGGAHDDRIYGSTGDDTLDGGNGTDHLDGGSGNDTCRRGNTTASCESESDTR